MLDLDYQPFSRVLFLIVGFYFSYEQLPEIRLHIVELLFFRTFQSYGSLTLGLSMVGYMMMCYGTCQLAILLLMERLKKRLRASILIFNGRFEFINKLEISTIAINRSFLFKEWFGKTTSCATPTTFNRKNDTSVIAVHLTNNEN